MLRAELSCLPYGSGGKALAASIRVDSIHESRLFLPMYPSGSCGPAIACRRNQDRTAFRAMQYSLMSLWTGRPMKIRVIVYLQAIRPSFTDLPQLIDELIARTIRA